MPIQSINPYNNQVMKTFDEFSDQQVDSAISRAYEAFQKWRVTNYSRRSEAIRIANDSPFGLGGAVFTEDLDRGKRVAEQVDSGMVFVNHPTLSSPELPFGGVKNSGFGRELSSLGITEFVNKKLVRLASVNDPL